MAEDDRFSKKVGWGFKKVYRIGCSATAAPVAARVAVRAFCKATREGGALPALNDGLAALSQAIEIFRATGSEESARNHLDVRTGTMELNHSNSTTIQVSDAAASCLEIAMARNMKVTDIPEAFLGNLAERLLDHQCFAPTREGMIEKSGRTSDQQAHWERQLSATCRPHLIAALDLAARRGDGQVSKCPSLPAKINAFNSATAWQATVEILP